MLLVVNILGWLILAGLASIAAGAMAQRALRLRAAVRTGLRRRHARQPRLGAIHFRAYKMTLVLIAFEMEMMFMRWPRWGCSRLNGWSSVAKAGC